MLFYRMNGWILSIGAIIVITTIITIILPEGKMGKFIRGYFALIIMVVILNPLLNLDGSCLVDFDNNEVEGVFIQNDFIDYVTRQKITKLQKNCEKICENKGISNAVVTIEYSVTENADYEILLVVVNLKKSVIISNGEHIDNIEVIRQTIADYLSIDLKLISVII